MAARIAITVASQLASAARINQPGDGAEAVPPAPAGMSETRAAPCGPETVDRSPSIIVVAGESVYRA
jgi:hypothetical protein